MIKNKIKKIVLAAFCLYSLFFVVGSIFAPIFAHFHQYDLSGKLTSLYMFSCHQRPERCFWLFGYPVALCCRCLGFYIGVSISSITAIVKNYTPPTKVLAAFIIVTIADIFCNLLLNINTGNYIRFGVGIIMGILFTSTICFIFREKEKRECLSKS